MVQINFAQKQISAKIVYYGPGMSGKTTNLEVVHEKAPSQNSGELTSISTDGDRTLFFDYMPLDLGQVAGMRTSFQIYTVPGQVYYNSTRKLVLQGVDGVIFVADSSPAQMEQNMESLRNLEENLNEYGKSLATLPHVIQYNKRDLPDAMSAEEMGAKLNPHGAAIFEAVASTGQGVFPTLKAVAATVLKNIMHDKLGEGGGEGGGSAPSHPAKGQQPLVQTGGPVAPNPAVPSGAPPAPAMQGEGAGAPAAAAGYAAPVAGQGRLEMAPPQAPAAGAQGSFASSAAAPAATTAPSRQAAGRPNWRNNPASGPGGLMKPGAQANVPARRGGQAAPAQRGMAAPAGGAEGKKNKMVFTGAFVAVAAIVGAVLAKFILGAL